MLAKYKFDSKFYAESVNVNPLIFTSYKDEVIDYNFTLNLSKHFKNVDETIVLDDVTHSYYFLQDNVLERIKEYLQERL